MHDKSITSRRIYLYTIGKMSSGRRKLNQKWSLMYSQFQKLPRRTRLFGLFLLCLWKLFSVSVVIYLMFYNHVPSISTDMKKSSKEGKHPLLSAAYMEVDSDSKPFRILHIVTALSEYNKGHKNTIKGQDRLQEVLIPLLKNGVESMIAQPNWEVDVYLILGWDLAPERKKLISAALPEGVGLEIWDDCVPLGYERQDPQKIQLITRALARQHRYVLKDKLDHYDFFLMFEDDMRVTSDHVSHFIKMTQQIEQLKVANREAISTDVTTPNQMTNAQLDRLIPGFIRVEVSLDENKSHQVKPPKIPTDFHFDKANKPLHIDPTTCCKVPLNTNKLLPKHPTSDQILVWETSIEAFSIRNTQLGWMGFMPGPDDLKLQSKQRISSYWTGNYDTTIFSKKPTPGDPHMFAQQGGFMASKEQILRFEKLCPGGFLPPFDTPIYKDDGLFMNNVEFWSGGFQLFGPGTAGCQLQRIVSIEDPALFSNHLLYHTANNKQIGPRTKTRLVRANDLLGQLNTVRKKMEKENLMKESVAS